MNLPERIRQRLKDAPDLPGCYLFRDRQGRIIYVGKAVSIRRRLQSYFRNTALRRGDPKLRSLVNSVCDIEFFTVRNEAEALLSEGRLIKEYKPRYNILFKDDKRFVLLRTDPREPFPQFRLCRLARQTFVEIRRRNRILGGQRQYKHSIRFPTSRRIPGGSFRAYTGRRGAD